MKREWRIRISWAFLLVLVLSTTVFGQAVLRGSIAGTIRDDSGAALPGVTVTVSSPALQVPQVVRVSDERGEYQVIDLPAGTFRVTYELPGFATLVREGIVLTTGFAARVDADMKVATLAETITVSGETPLVDVTSTRGGTTVSQALIAEIPSNKNAQDLTVMVPGLVVAGPPMTGEITAGRGGFTNMKTYGQNAGQGGAGTQMIEGIKMQPNEVPDLAAYEELDVKTFGNTADVDVPGVFVQYVVKSGGNQFHGKYTETAQHHRFESVNIDAALAAQGLSTGNSILYYNDITADIGGRIIRDKLWFYTAIRDYRNKTTRLGYAKDPGPDATYGTVDDTPAFPTGRHLSTTFKISYQPTPSHRFISFGQYNPDYSVRPDGSRYVPEESNYRDDQYSRETKPIEWQGTFGTRLVVNALWGHGGWTGLKDYLPPGRWEPNCNFTCPSRFDRASLLNTGPSTNAIPHSGPLRQQFSGRANYLPSGSFGGSHEIETGYRVWLGNQNSKSPRPDRLGIGIIRLIYDTVGGVPHQPVEMTASNAPVNSFSNQNVQAAYVMDSWRMTDRLTVNLGLRWERQIHWLPPQEKAQGIFGSSGSFPRVDAGTWSALAPRVGVAFDLSGDGKTVVKATYGRFNHDLVVGYAGAFNQNSVQLATYRWRDLNGDLNYQPGEVNLNLNGPDFLSITGGTQPQVNPNLKLPHTHEATGSLERDLARGLSIRGLFVYKKVIDNFLSANPLRPYNVYNRVFTRRDPGPDGVLSTADDGELFTLYDYDPAYRGAAFTSTTNVNADSDRADSFRSAEVSMTKRATGNWFANTSFLVTKNHRWLIRVPQSPNDLINALDENTEWSYRLAGGYNLPRGINVSTLYSMYSGFPRQRTNVFRAADPAGGPAFPSSSTITMRMEPLGAKTLPVRHVLNLRAGKDFRIGRSRRITTNLDVFNAINSNAAWQEASQGSPITEASGPTYGYVTRIVYPRVLRFGVGFEF